MALKRLRILVASVALWLAGGMSVAQTLTIAHNQDPSTLNPLMTTVAAEESVALAIVEKMAMFEAGTMQTVPWLLESWEFLSPTELLLHVKDGISFTNGEPLDAEAVRFSFEAWREQPVMAQASAALQDATFEATGPLSVLITTARPVPGIITTLGRYGYVVPPKYYSDVGPEGFSRAPIGTGPYILESHQAGDRVTLVRNPDYWRSSPGFERVIFRVMPEDFSRAAALESGEVDLAYLLSDTSASRLDGTPGVEIHRLAGLRKFGAIFNAEMPGGEPLLDPLVRQALNHAIDTQAIVDSVFAGEAVTLGGAFALPSEFGYRAVEPFPYDPSLARQMLAQAGYPNGFPLTLAYTAGRYPKDLEVGDIVASYLSAVGLTITQRPLEWGQFNTERSNHTLGQMFIFGLLFPPDLENTFTYMAFGKEARGAPLLTWSDRWWELYEESQVTVDQERRAELFGEMLQIDRDEPYGVYLYAPNDAYGSRDTIQGFQPREDQYLMLYDVMPR